MMSIISKESTMATRKKAAPPAPPPAPEPPPKKPRATPRKRKLQSAAVEVKYVMPGKDAVLQLNGYEEAPVEPTPIEVIELGLTKTSIPGVYKNQVGVLVDGDGVMIDHATLKNRDQERFEKIIGGPVDSPAKLLKAVALDPQLPLNTRLTAATSAAPYFDRKKPIGIDGGADGAPITMEHIHKIQGMSKEELDRLERLLALGAGAVLGEEASDGNDA
jgi:hypothetical protein